MANLDLQALSDAIDEFARNVRVAYERARTLANSATNALKLGGKDGAATRSGAATAMNNHVASRSNPHVLTAAQINAYPKSEFLQLIDGLVPSGIVPFTVFGLNQFGGQYITPGTGFRFSIYGPIDLLMAGRKFTMAGIDNFDLTTVKANPANTTFAIYVVMVNGQPEYRIVEDLPANRLAESPTRMYVGYVITNGTTINNRFMTHRDRLDIYFPSTNGAGTAVAATGGQPQTTGAGLDPSWK